MDDSLIQITTPTCRHCGKTGSVALTDEQLNRARSSSVPIQHALHDLSADDREMLISGTHPACWDKMMGPELD